MTAPTAPSLQQLGLGDFDNEMASTRRILERVPDEHFDWKPHPKSKSLGELASHVATIVGLQNIVIREDELDFMRPGARVLPPAAKSRAELLDTFDQTVASVRASLATVTDDATWSRPWALRRGEQTIFELPKVAAFRTLGLSHLVHHRGQLTVYLRLLDVPVPGMYGPSADEPLGAR